MVTAAPRSETICTCIPDAFALTEKAAFHFQMDKISSGLATHPVAEIFKTHRPFLVDAWRRSHPHGTPFARVAEMVDARDLKSLGT